MRAPAPAWTGQPGQRKHVEVSALAGDLPALVERVRAHGGGTVEGPLDTPWNTRDVRLTDPHGYRVVYTARRARGERDQAFSARIQQLTQEQLGDGTRTRAVAHGSAVARGEDSFTSPKRW